MLFIIHHTPVTAKGGCLWQLNNGNTKIRTLWWNISLMATPVCAESSVNTAAKLSTLRPETANIAASRPAATRCWTYAKASESVLSAERTPALAVGSSSYQFGQMPDIAAMPVGRKTTASAKRRDTLQLTIFVTCQISCFSLRNLIKIVKFLTHAYFYKVKWYFPFWEVPKYRNA